MSDPRENAFVNGYEARGAEVPFEDCPYLAGDMKDAWEEGWADADATLDTEEVGEWSLYEDMDGDHESALASAGFGTDEDYGGWDLYEE